MKKFTCTPVVYCPQTPCFISWLFSSPGLMPAGAISLSDSRGVEMCREDILTAAHSSRAGSDVSHVVRRSGEGGDGDAF